MGNIFELNNVICISLVSSIILVAYLFLRKFLQQNNYYKKIIDNSTHIVIVHDLNSILTVNKTFFDYFKTCISLEDFKKDYICISDCFEEEEGCLSSSKGGLFWFETLLNVKNKKYKVKINIHDDSFYFLIAASLLDKKKNIYALILTDITEQESTRDKLHSLSIKDKLTNIGNREYYDDILNEHITLAQRYPHTFSLVLLDIDYFKKINDSLGHDVGDSVLQEYTKVIGYHLREMDIFCRIGGEEFILLLPETTKDKAYTLSQKLRMLVENHKKITSLTMSFGIVEYQKGDNAQSIFKRVDKALYRAKDMGRNKVIIG